MTDWLTFDGTTRQRFRKLTVKFTASPMLPAIGWSKCVESIVANGPLLAWTAYTVLITAAWIFADDIERAADEVAETVD